MDFFHVISASRLCDHAQQMGSNRVISNNNHLKLNKNNSNPENTLNVFALQQRLSLRFCSPDKYTGSISAVRLRQDAENKITYDRAILPLKDKVVRCFLSLMCLSQRWCTHIIPVKRSLLKRAHHTFAAWGPDIGTSGVSCCSCSFTS